VAGVRWVWKSGTGWTEPVARVVKSHPYEVDVSGEVCSILTAGGWIPTANHSY
jgi:hypothetical protein